MGLTTQSTGINSIDKSLKISRKENSKIIALAGNPNVGKSSIFNILTGLKQHTGNWPGKTVTNASGSYNFRDIEFTLVDLPGTYSLMANSIEEEIARDFICFGGEDFIIIIVDATCLERNLNLVLQTLEITNNVIVCVNLIDEAKRKGISIDTSILSKTLGIDVIKTSATKKIGINELKSKLYTLTKNKIIQMPIKIKYNDDIEKAISIIEPTLVEHFKGIVNTRWLSLKLLENDSSILDSILKHLDFQLNDDNKISNAIKTATAFMESQNITHELLNDSIASTLVKTSEKISKKVISITNSNYSGFDKKIDAIVTSKHFGIPIMILLLGIVFWITLIGANYPSSILSNFFFYIENQLTEIFNNLNVPIWIEGVLLHGLLKTLGWVISVMLPPMAIFFPIFTLLEDLGYLPRIAFNLDNCFRKSCSCGKQGLTMCMGFGCNAAGIIGCRIINSPRERLIAIITNNFVPCNGRFPTLIAIIAMFFSGIFIEPLRSIVSTLILTFIIILGIFMTLIVSKLLSNTILKGLPSSFTLELPAFRKPQVKQVIIHSILDRTLFVLGRAIVVAAPAGIVIWIMANININNISILNYCASFFDPFAKLIGLDGYILMAFILGFPANEIVIPIIIMSYMNTGSIIELNSIGQLHTLLVNHGWTWLTAICVMLFSLMHWPCSTTCLTIKKETQSFKWTLISFLIPTICGIVICFSFTTFVRILGLI